MKNFSLLSLAAAVTFALTACGESSSSKSGPSFGGGTEPTPPPVTEFDESQLIANVVDNIILPSHQSFVDALTAHRVELNTYCTALSNNEDATDAESSAKESYLSTMAAWQAIEVMQLEPLLENDNELRNLIYSWPTISSCGVDQDVIYFEDGQINETPYDITNRSVSRRGLDSLEYLLFNENLNHSCSSDSGIVAGWNDRADAERTLARCNFALEVAEDIHNSVNELRTTWAGDTGYAAQLKSAGEPGSNFATTHEAVNIISDALFYIDKFTKDEKLGNPLGYFANDCGNAPCSEEVESKYSDTSLDNIANNLEALRKLFQGEGTDTENTLGFDDYLREVGDEETAQQMENDINLAYETADSAKAEGSLAEQIESGDIETAEGVHSQVKSITDQLKTDFITSLSLELPETSAGDND